MDDAAFRKDDKGKYRWSLVPTDAMRGVISALEDGAKTYGDHNWAKGADWSRYYNALKRHLDAWWEGERRDPKSGLPHLWHVGANALFLIAYEIRGVGRDDRPVLSPEQEPTASEEAPSEAEPTSAKPSYSPSDEEIRWAVDRVAKKVLQAAE